MMSSRRRIVFWVASLLLLLSSAVAQRRRDPLTEVEINQLRDTAMEPDLRLKLYVTFARARLDAVEKAIIEADTEFQAKLRALKDSADATKDEAKKYEFLLSNTLETIDTSVPDHRQLLDEQEEAAKNKKKPKP